MEWIYEASEPAKHQTITELWIKKITTKEDLVYLFGGLAGNYILGEVQINAS
jgi:hypothetical protein